MSTIKIVVFSDIHISGHLSSWNAIFDKRICGFFSRYFLRRCNKNIISILNKTIRSIINLKPDIVLFTGDLTSIGEVSEFSICCEVLSPLVENTSFDFFCIPGNHDSYVHDEQCNKKFNETFSYLNSNKIQNDDLPKSVIIHGLDFCFINECRPMPLFSSNGIISEYDRKYVTNWAMSEHNFPKILVGHYPLTENSNWIFWRTLIGHESLLDLLNKKYIDVSLCGHSHKFVDKLNKIDGRGEVITGSVISDHKLTVINYDSTRNYFECSFVHI